MSWLFGKKKVMSSSTSPVSEAAQAITNQEDGDMAILQKLGTKARLRRHFSAEINKNHTDILMLVCCLISGLVDSTIYNAYGHFVSMQTGNTIFVGLGSSISRSTTTPYGWAKSLTSIICFMLGALFFSRFCRFLHPLRRGTLSASFLVQALIIIISTIIIQSGAVDGSVPTVSGSNEIDWKSEIPIALLSFQSAGQIVGSKMLGLSEIPTIVLTNSLCDLMSDPMLVSPLTANAKRNRRALAFFGILVGAIAGGWITKASGSIQSVLWISGALKLCIAISWVFWPHQRINED